MLVSAGAAAQAIIDIADPPFRMLPLHLIQRIRMAAVTGLARVIRRLGVIIVVRMAGGTALVMIAVESEIFVMLEGSGLPFRREWHEMHVRPNSLRGLSRSSAMTAVIQRGRLNDVIEL
jgi:hypothetical protein